MKRFSSYAVWLWSVIVFTLTVDCALADRRVALVIGNAKYQKINALTNPVHDAPDIAESLRKIGFDVIVRTDTDKGNFDRALSEFARKAAGSDAALFYYAGHGIQYQKTNYLLPIDIEVEDYNDVEFQAVSINRVMDALSRTSGVKIVILDSCRDNPLDKRLTTASRTTVGQTRGLARLDRTEGLVVAYATAPDQVAQDGSGRNSPFTESLIRRLDEPGLEVATLFRRVTQDVFERTNGRQRPEVSISLLNDYFLNLAASDSQEWARVRDSVDPGDFKGFIQKYPGSPFSREAQFRLDLFDRIRRDNDDRVRLDQQRVALERERELRESLEKERAALAAERLAFERREAERREQEKLASEKREAERLAAERQEATRRETERLALDKREADRRDAERQAALKREADRLEGDKREAARKEIERLAAEKIAADKREADRLGAEKREADRLAAQRREDARKEAERLAAEKKAEAVRLAKEQQDNAKREAELQAAQKREAEKLAAQQREAKRKENELLSVEKRAEAEAAQKAQQEIAAREAERLASAKREAEKATALQREAARKEAEKLAAEKKAEADRLVAEQKDAQRREAERVAAEKKGEQERIRVAALHEADLRKQQAEADKKRLAGVCESEGEDVKRLASQKDKAALDAFRKQAACPTIALTLDKAIKDVAAAEARACETDKKALSKVGAKDLAALRGAFDAMSCDGVRKDANARIVKLEADEQKLELACTSESDKVTQAKTAGNEALSKLGALQKALTCDRLRPVVAEAIKELAALAPKAAEVDTKRQILEAQTELKRVGCYTGNLNGTVNNGTRQAISKYFTRINSSAREVQFSDELVEELKRRDAGLCPVETPPANVARRPAREEEEEEVAPRPSRRKPAVVETPRVPRAPVVRIERERPAAPARVAAPRPAPVAAAPRVVAAPRPAAPVASAPRINVIGVGF